ncbi:hypothetical protein JCM13664_19340 [Methylothermus subterraneus]|nr:hypothetical protein HGMM_F04H05C27 [uncultured Gammaproteobacteria bacterium]
MAISPDLEQELKTLTEKIERLAALCEKLCIENQQLKEQLSLLTAERDRYLSCAQSARKRVKQMLERMQSLS